MYGCKPEAYKVPVAAITRADGSQMSGVLVYAYMWNAPPGCFRIRTKEVFAIEKIKTLANSEESLWKTEVEDQFTASFAGHGDAQLTSQSLHLLSTRASWQVAHKFISMTRNYMQVIACCELTL